MNKTEPRTLPGFMELLPQDQILYTQIKETLQNIEAHKFNPIKEDKNGICKYCPYKFMCRLDLV